MIVTRRALLALLFGAVAAPAAAQSLGFGFGVQDVVVRAGGRATAPLDAFTAPTGAYSFRKLKSTYSGPAIRIRRASDNLETDINFLGYVPGLGSPLDTAMANAHCAATSCFIRTWYDQSGNARHLGQATPASQPTLIFNCIGALPCFELPAAAALQTVSNNTPATGIMSLSVVANRVTAATGTCYFLSANGGAGNRIQSSNSNANVWNLTSPGGGGMGVTAASPGWHAMQAVIANSVTASAVNGDGVETLGSATGNLTVAAIFLGGAAGLVCREAEAVLWDNYQLTVGERTALQQNQKSYWGTP